MPDVERSLLSLLLKLNLLDSSRGRTALFVCLYASEGGPIGFIWWALPTLLRVEQLDVSRITSLTAMLVLPWTLKFLWAPVVDSLRSARWGFREWIITSQVLMGLTLLPLISLNPVDHFEIWRVLLLLHAIAAATQDVSIDALAINAVPEHERGSINGGMQFGMLTGRSVFGGGAVLVAHKLGWDIVFTGLIGWIWFSLGLLLLVREPAMTARPRDTFAAFRNHLKRASRQGRTWLGILFALVSGAAFEATGALGGPYLIDRRISQATVGWFFGIAVVAAMIVGSLAGGKLSDMWGRTRSVATFLIGFTTMICALGIADQLYAETPPVPLILGLLGAMYLFIGLFTAASYALFMDLTDRHLGATQFSTYMSATNGCESWATWAGGRIVSVAGYAVAMLLMCGVSVLSLPVLRRLRSG